MEASSEKSKLSSKPFTIIAIVVFSFVSCMHLFRLFFEWEIILNGLVVPLWFSVLGFVIAAGLAVMLWREAQK
ncbi:MAG: hypothetical protein V3U15_05590 [Nitrospinota bacterium]